MPQIYRFTIRVTKLLNKCKFILTKFITLFGKTAKCAATTLKLLSLTSNQSC